MATANQVADYILGKIDPSAGDSITHLKLQKLVYYCQAWHLALRNKPLFDEDIEAWLHGPVVRSVWQRFNCYEWNAIPPTERDLDGEGHLSERQRELIDEVWEAYGHLSGSQLRVLTHSEDPWREARKDVAPDARSQETITRASMRAYYKSRLEA